MIRPAKAACAALLPLCIALPPAMALCMDGRAPTIAQEAAQATAVVDAQVVQTRDLHEDASDPDGTTATRYTVRVLRTLRGRAPPMLSLYSENTSARFPMETGERYLLFVLRDASGRYFIDACGNSGPLVERLPALRTLGGAKTAP